jgi:hypothetical protein
MRWAKNAKDGKQPARGLRRMRAPSGAGGSCKPRDGVLQAERLCARPFGSR